MSTYEEDRARDRDETRRAMTERDEAALRLAHNIGRLDQIYEGLRHDPEHVALMRGLAWARTGRTFSMKDGKPDGVPTAWPPGVDQDTFIGDWIDKKKAEHAAPARPGAPSDGPVSPAVRRLRELIG